MELADDDLDDERDGDRDQRYPDRATERLLGQAARHFRAQPATGQRPGDPGGEDIPLDLAEEGMGGEGEEPEGEADHEVRADGAMSGQADAAKQRRHPQCAEDHPDGPAEKPDQSSEDDARREARLRGRPSPERAQQQVEAVPGQYGRDQREKESGGKLIRQQRSNHRSRDRRRSHPGDDAPVNATFPCMPVAPGRRRGRADRDVRPGARCRVAGEQEDGGKPERPEDEPDCRSEIARREARGER
jgi:hypothetical protein